MSSSILDQLFVFVTPIIENKAKTDLVKVKTFTVKLE